MPCVKVINSGYNSPEDMMRLINYIISDEKHETNGLIGGYMILTGSPQYVYDQMMAVKNHYNKATGQFMRHIIVSPSEIVDVNLLYIIAMQICKLFPEYQSVFAIHLEKEIPHIHIGINTVPFVEANKLRINLPALKLEINRICSEYVPYMV